MTIFTLSRIPVSARFYFGEGIECDSRDGTGLFSLTMISELLRNRFYLGETSYGAKVKGKHRKWMDGNHDAIVSKELFAACQQVRGVAAKKSNKNAHNKKRPYPLSPMLICIEQEIRWRGQVQHGFRRYLRKRNNGIPGTYVKADELESSLIDVVASIEFPNNWKKQVISCLQINEKPKAKPKASKQKLERLKKLFVLGHMSEGEYMKAYDEIQKGLKQSAISTVSIDDLSIIKTIMKDLKSLWELATLEEKDRLAKLLFHKIYMRESKEATAKSGGFQDCA